MAPRRGIVVSDDEQTPAPATSSRSRQSLASTSRPSKSKHSRESRDSRPTEVMEADLDLPIVSVLSPEDVGKIRVLETETFGLTQKLTSAMSMISDAAVAVEELHVTAANHETVTQLEMSLRSLIDAHQHLKHSQQAIQITSTFSEISAAPVPLHEKYLTELTSQDDAYNQKHPSEKYTNISEYQDFKRRVWDINHKNEPPPSTWFPKPRQPNDPSSLADPDSDDDLVLGHEIQSLKCPITLQLLEKPVRNTACPHVYSLEAIRELVRHGRGMIACPVAGCGEQVSMGSVKEDKGMARRVRVERERILEEGRVEREGEEVGEDSMVVDENVKVE